MMDLIVAHGSMAVLLLFFSIFLAFGFWAFRPSNKHKLQSYGDIPLKETGDNE